MGTGALRCTDSKGVGDADVLGRTIMLLGEGVLLPADGCSSNGCRRLCHLLIAFCLAAWSLKSL